MISPLKKELYPLNDEGSIKNDSTSVINSAALKAGRGAVLQFKLKYYRSAGDIKISVYKGDSTAKKDKLGECTQKDLVFSSGNAVVTIPVTGMPYTDKVTVLAQADGKQTRKVLPLSKVMTDDPLAEARIRATGEILGKHAELLETGRTKSVTYERSSRYLMLNDELWRSLQDVLGAGSAEELEQARAKGLKILSDTSEGIYHHGVDVCIQFNGTFRLARVPETACVFTAMCAALEQAYPDGHWFYLVTPGKFGLVFQYAGYLADNTDSPGVREEKDGIVAGQYGASDYFTDYRLGGLNSGLPLANGISSQCVWNGMVTGTPRTFQNEGAPGPKIKLEINKNDITWDLARLLQHYTEDELTADETYMEAYALRKPEADAAAQEKALTALRLEYLDILYADSTDAAKNVIRRIAALKEGDDTAPVREAYEQLSREEKDDVFNYKDLVEKEQAGLTGDELLAAQIDELIRSVGTVEYTEDCRERIEKAEKACEEAGPEARGMVTLYDALGKARKSFEAMKEEKVSAFEDAVKALPGDAEDVGYPGSREAVEAAEAAWDALLEAEQKSLSAEHSVLEKAREAYDKAKAEYYSKNLNGAVRSVLQFLDRKVTDPGVSQVGGEWAVLAQARGGLDKPKYYDRYYRAVTEYVRENGSGKLDGNKSSENSRVILALASIGKDAGNVAGYDLTAPYADLEWVKNQGINGAIFALLALDAGGYDLPAGALTGDPAVEGKTIREKLTGHLLDEQVPGGGWSLDGEKADADITAMALQALAPYRDDDEAGAAIENALKVLCKIQNSDGGFGSDMSGRGSNPESTAQVVIALLTLGINPVEDARFMRGSANPLTCLSEYQLGDGSFEHTKGGGYDQMTTEQAALALVAYKRFLAGDTALYDMADKTLDRLPPKSDSLAGTGGSGEGNLQNSAGKGDGPVQNDGDRSGGMTGTDRNTAGQDIVSRSGAGAPAAAGKAIVPAGAAGKHLTAAGNNADPAAVTSVNAGWRFTGETYEADSGVRPETVSLKPVLIIIICLTALTLAAVYMRRKRGTGRA